MAQSHPAVRVAIFGSTVSDRLSSGLEAPGLYANATSVVVLGPAHRTLLVELRERMCLKSCVGRVFEVFGRARF